MNFSNYTLIIPTVSTGNVPQLCTDVLIHNYPFKHYKVLDSTLLYPFASPIDYTTEPISGTSTGLELYVCETLKTAIVVQRSPVIPQYTRNFIDYLSKEVIDGFNKVVLLDSHEAVIQDDPTKRVKIYNDNDSLIQGVENLKLKEETAEDSRFSDFGKEFIDLVYNSIRVLALVIDVYEGDNSSDAKLLAKSVCTSLEFPQNSLSITPKSWEGVYGDRPIPIGVEGGLFS